MHQPIFQRLLGPHVETEEVDPHLVHGGLLKAEQEAVEGAAQTRIEQFTAGRVCSRIALGRLGVATTTPSTAASTGRRRRISGPGRFARKTQP